MVTMNTEDKVRNSFFEQAKICNDLGSSFMFSLLDGLGRELTFDTESGSKVLNWQGDPHPKVDALALRLAGAIHAIVRRGSFPELEKYYDEPEKTPDTHFIPLVLKALEQHDEEVLSWLKFAPQTNEVARSAIIFSGLLEIADSYQMPISLFELGSSGGLNLQMAQFGFTFAGQAYGKTDSILQLQPDWEGGLPPIANVDVVHRQGCDLNPLSVLDEKHCEKLVAFLWPDQPMRIDRVRAAIEIAKQAPPQLDKSDAADWVEDVFVEADTSGTVKVLFHTIAWNYFDPSSKKRIEDAVAEAGSRATEKRPLAWLTFEFEEDLQPRLRLRTWPDGKDQILAQADPHVYKIVWEN